VEKEERVPEAVLSGTIGMLLKDWVLSCFGALTLATNTGGTTWFTSAVNVFKRFISSLTIQMNLASSLSG